MSRLRKPGLLCGVLAVCGCFEFTGIDADSAPAWFAVSIVAVEDADELRLSASLSPGRDDDGMVRAVLSDLVVFGQPLAPSSVAEDGRAYEEIWSLAATNAPITLVLPRIEGIDAGPAVVELSVPTRAGPDTLRASSGDDLVLDIRRDTTPAGTPARWDLTVADSAGMVVLVLQSAGHPPEQITVPAAWLPAAPHSVRTVVLGIHHSSISTLAGGQYRVSAGLRTELHWTVVRTP